MQSLFNVLIPNTSAVLNIDEELHEIEPVCTKYKILSVVQHVKNKESLLNIISRTSSTPVAAVESMSMGDILVALEAEKDGLWKRFVEWIKEMCRRVWDSIQEFFSSVKGLKEKVESSGKKLSELNPPVKIDEYMTKYNENVFSELKEYVDSEGVRSIEATMQSGFKALGSYITSSKLEIQDEFKLTPIEDIVTIKESASKMTIATSTLKQGSKHYEDVIYVLSGAIEITKKVSDYNKAMDEVVKNNKIPEESKEAGMDLLRKMTRYHNAYFRNVTKCARMAANEYLKRANALLN